MPDPSSALVASSAATPSRRWILLALASVGWLVSFAVLRRLGTWTSFAVLGPVLAVAALRFGAVPVTLLRPRVSGLVIGLSAGLSMVAATHLAYAWAAGSLPALATATARLFELLEVGGFSPASRAGLIAVIGASEEILFRGPLVPASRAARDGWVTRPTRTDWLRVTVFAAGYALATVPLGSTILVLCAFVCGMAWGLLRVGTASLVAPIVAHVVWDLGVLVAWPLMDGP